MVTKQVTGTDTRITYADDPFGGCVTKYKSIAARQIEAQNALTEAKNREAKEAANQAVAAYEAKLKAKADEEFKAKVMAVVSELMSKDPKKKGWLL